MKKDIKIKASIIIRCRNEERWINKCLKAVYNQDFKEFEVILIDNQSTDGTVNKASKYPVKLFSVSEYKPGKAINFGINESQGEFIVLLSGHCVPVDSKWLSNLLKSFENSNVAGVYGRQKPFHFSSVLSKRDLLNTFGIERRVQHKDSFFHNANSAIRQKIWEKIPFNEDVTNIEDRLWAEKIIKSGYTIVYDPDSAVYHYHGIHHDNDQLRLTRTGVIVDKFSNKIKGHSYGVINKKDLHLYAFIPYQNKLHVAEDINLLDYSVKRALESKYVKKIVVISDCAPLNKYKKYKKIIFLARDDGDPTSLPDVNTLYKHSLLKLEKKGHIIDLILTLDPFYPLRSTSLIDKLFEIIVEEGCDTVIPGKIEYSSCWIDNGKFVKRVDEGDIPYLNKNPVIIGAKGLAGITYTEYIRQDKFYGEDVRFYKKLNNNSFINFREESNVKFKLDLLKEYFSK